MGGMFSLLSRTFYPITPSTPSMIIFHCLTNLSVVTHFPMSLLQRDPGMKIGTDLLERVVKNLITIILQIRIKSLQGIDTHQTHITSTTLKVFMSNNTEVKVAIRMPEI